MIRTGQIWQSKDFPKLLLEIGPYEGDDIWKVTKLGRSYNAYVYGSELVDNYKLKASERICDMKDEYHYLVVRYDYIRHGSFNNRSKINHSDYFPLMIKSSRPLEFAEVLERALDSIDTGYRPKFEYLIVDLANSNHVIGSLKPPVPEMEFTARRVC